MNEEAITAEETVEKPIILQARKLCKTYRNPAKVQILKNFDLTVRRGESIAIMGRSGEGKSTLLQILGTLESPCSGSLEIDGQLISSFNKSRIRNRKLGFIFQSFHLLEDYSALENVLIPARIGRKSVSQGEPAYGRACDLLKHVGLEDRMHFNAKLLSGGEKQRVAIARALCNEPDIILADEPSGNLDKETSRHIHQLLLDLSHCQGKTLIIVTHDPELAAMCSLRYNLVNGQLVDSH
jgi:lipoprotein-releasing system ATP-binding protein